MDGRVTLADFQAMLELPLETRAIGSSLSIDRCVAIASVLISTRPGRFIHKQTPTPTNGGGDHPMGEGVQP